MSAKISPGGALLRTSRMFSLPKPIPNAPADSLLNKNPNLGTSTHPTHQSITTYQNNRNHGDWGLKRSLPLRHTLKSSTPAVRVRAVDAPEMITDYASASEHTLTVQKFRELGVPLTVPALPNSFRGITSERVSVFEEDSDFTFDPAEGTADSSKRWKFNGPWLAGMNNGEFNQYLRTTVRNKRAGFKAFLKNRFASETNAAAQQAALQDGSEAPAPITAEDITEEQYAEQVRKLRADRVALYSFVSEFLDLAPISPPSALASLSAGGRVQAKSPNPYAERGPPTMHPSGGLSYLRTAAHVENHPVYGPQAQPAPALTRIITAKVGSTPAKLGVAGFVADPPQGDTAWNTRAHRSGSRTKVGGLTWFDPTIPGGPKTYMQPRTATINSAGKVILKLDEASEVSQLIAKELIGEADIYNKPPTERAPEQRYRSFDSGDRTKAAPRRDGPRRAPREGSSKTYGV